MIKLGASAEEFFPTNDARYFNVAGDAVTGTADFQGALRILNGTSGYYGRWTLNASGDLIYAATAMPPASAPTATLKAATPGNLDPGVYTYKVTYTTAGGETTGSSASNAVTVVDKAVAGQIDLTVIPISGYTGTLWRKIYRSKDGGPWLLVGNVANNTGTTLTDNLATGTDAIPATNTAVDTRLTLGNSGAATFAGSLLLPNGTAAVPALVVGTAGYGLSQTTTGLNISLAAVQRARFTDYDLLLQGTSSGLYLGAASDVAVYRAAAGNPQWGVNSASPIGYTHNLAPSVTPGGATVDTAGAAAVLKTGAGVGTGGSGFLYVATAGPGVSGNAANVFSNKWFWSNYGHFLPVTDNAMVIGGAGNMVRSVGTGRIVTGSATPTVASTGIGATGTVTVQAGSSDLAGNLVVTPGGAGIAATGDITLTFSTSNGALGTNLPVCVAMLANAGGTWNARATVIGNGLSTTAAYFKWDNNAVALTAASNYLVSYHCIGK
ncbi:MAG: hypothetical protein WA208_01485 [Thermoanaerobaculia bacterium]